MRIFTATLNDDRGRSVRLLEARSVDAGDNPRLAAAMSGVEDVLRHEPRSGHQGGAGCLFGVAVVALAIGFRYLFPSAPGWTTYGVYFAGASAWLILLNADRRQAKSKQVADSVLRVGCCASCGYALEGTPETAEGLIVCPECDAAWRTSRVFFAVSPGYSRMHPTATASGNRLIDRFIHNWFGRPAIQDDRGRAVTIVNFRDGTLRRLQSDYGAKIRDRVARQTLFGRGALGAFSIVFVVVIGLVIASSIRRSGAIPGWTVVWGLIVAALMIQAWRRWTGRMPEICKHAASILKSAHLCPSCAHSLRGAEPEADGLVVCSRCGAAWKTGL